MLVLGGDGTGLSPDARPLADFSAKVTFSDNRPSALALVRKQGKLPASRRPALILVDLGHHGEQGWALLRELKGDPQLKRIPVIVLGASNSGEERARAYDLHANSYLPRPKSEVQLRILLERIEEFWLSRVRLPAG
jgi:chemotaxis family two-component system response regulator Rcp1